MSTERPLRWEEELLIASAARTSWPATPELRSRVLGRVSPPTPTLPRKGGGGLGAAARPVVLAALALLVVVLLAVVSVPSTRTAVAEFFGLVEGYRIERVPATVTPTPAAGIASSTPTATAVPTATLLRDVAQPSTLAEAAERVGSEVMLPTAAAGLEPEVYLLDTGFGASEVATVVLRYPAFDLWEARVGGRPFLNKGVPDGEVIEVTSVHGAPAYWVGGFARTVRFVDADGREVPGTERVVTQRALVWSTTSAFYRIETDLPLTEALRIAESLP